MLATTGALDQRCRYVGDGYELIVRPPGAYQTIAPDHSHFLDVHIGGTKGPYSIEGLEEIGTESPPNSVVFVPADRFRDVHVARSGWSVQLNVQPAWFGTLLQSMPLKDVHGIRLICHEHDEALVGVASVLRDLVTASSGDLPAQCVDALATSLLMRTAYHFAEIPHPKSNSPSVPTRIQAVLEYIEDNLDGPLSLIGLAEVANTSPYHFARMFRRAMSRTLQHYITERRLERAKKLLIETDSSIAQISYECGFGSQSHMTNVFTKVLGVTPGALRKGAR